MILQAYEDWLHNCISTAPAWLCTKQCLCALGSEGSWGSCAAAGLGKAAPVCPGIISRGRFGPVAGSEDAPSGGALFHIP